jgi:hypothetical protein
MLAHALAMKGHGPRAICRVWFSFRRSNCTVEYAIPHLTTDVPALRSVQRVELFKNELLTGQLGVVCTEFSTDVLKTISRAGKRVATKKIRDIGSMSPGTFSKFWVLLACNFLQQLLINIEICVDVLDIIMIFEHFEQSDHGIRRLPLKLDVILRNHCDF